MLQLFTLSRCRRRVDYKFYNQLEQILGHEAVSIDEYDERDEQPDQDPGTVNILSHIHIVVEEMLPLIGFLLHLQAIGADGVNTAWTEQETVALVEVWAADDVQHSLKTCVRNGHIFIDISEKMASMGYMRTAEQCHSRIKRLKKTYRRFCNSRR